MRKLAILAALTVMAAPGYSQAGQTVSTDTVDALRQMAIANGQTSSSRAEGAAIDEGALISARDSIARHRSTFVARTFSSVSGAVATHPLEERSARALTNAWQPTRTGQIGLSVPVRVAPSVKSETVLALRQLAIDAGQVSRSSTQASARARSVTKTEQRAIKDRRATFFGRNFGDGPVM